MAALPRLQTTVGEAKGIAACLAVEVGVLLAGAAIGWHSNDGAIHRTTPAQGWWSYFVHNEVVALTWVAGAVTFGLLATLLMVVASLDAGTTIGMATRIYGSSAFGSLTHAGFELSGLAVALWISLTPGRLVLHRYGRDRRGSPPTVRRLACLIVVMTILLAMAAAIEASLPTLTKEAAA